MKLSTVQMRCLYDAKNHGDPWHSCKGRSEHGGRNGTITSLNKLGFLHKYELTTEGLAFLSALENPPPMTDAPPPPPKPKKKTLDFIRKLSGNALLAGPFDQWPPEFKAEAYTLEKYNAAKKRGAIPSQGGEDKIYTPDAMALAIVEHFKPRGTILEPFAGGGAFVRAFHAYNEAHTVREPREKWTGPGPLTLVDKPLSVIDSMELEPPDGSPGTDFFKQGPPLVGYDWICTNHPWSKTEETLKETMWLAPDVILLCYIGSIFTDHRQKLIEDAGFVVAEIARMDRPKTWGSMGMQLAAMHLKHRATFAPGLDPDFCRMSRIEYDNPAPTK